MVYMVIFSALAIGFYAATTTSSQLASNEKSSIAAQVSAESGIQFLRYHLSALDIVAGLRPDQAFEEVFMQLESRLENSPNLDGSRVGYDGMTISIPERGYVHLDAAKTQRFRITISRAGDKLVANVVGRGGNVSVGRGVEIEFSKAENATDIFNFGVASRGRVLTSGNSTITGLTDPTKGSILSTNRDSLSPVEIFGKKISGDVSIVTNADVKFGSGVSIGGTSNVTLIRRDHIHKNAREPRFPDIDTIAYEQEVVRTFSTTDSDNVITTEVLLENIRIPSGSGTKDRPLVFGGGARVRGVVYIEGSNVIEFGGNVNIQGVIVTANTAAQPIVELVNTEKVVTNNVLSFTGSVTASPIEDLDPVLYAGENWDRIRKLDGAFIIAPTYRVSMWGNFGNVGGSVICAQFQMGGSAEGTIEGSIIQMRDDVNTSISGSADVVIASTGTTEYPPGVTFGHHYTPVYGSYKEVRVD